MGNGLVRAGIECVLAYHGYTLDNVASIVHGDETSYLKSGTLKTTRVFELNQEYIFKLN